MTEQLATWVWVGAAALACVAGIVNVVGYLGFEHQAITHLTGTTSLLGAALAEGNLRAIGLQNAMATTCSDAIIRTSHVSGMFNDLGISLGHALRGLPVNQRRLWLCLVIIVAFLAGGIAGALLFGQWQYRSLYIPAVLTGTAGIIYGVYRHQQIVRGRITP